MSLELRRWRSLLLALIVAATALVVTLGGGSRAAFAAADLAAGRPATADSSQAGHEPGHGNDGNAGTRWCAANGATGHWWQVDLGATVDLTGTEVVWEFARNYRYRIETSADAVAWRVAADHSADAGTAQTRTDEFTTRGRYVRVTVTGLPDRTWASFSTFRVFGGTPPADGPEPDPALRAQCTGTSPVTCHYALTPGHYDVTVVLGDRTAGTTTVQAEARRILLPAVQTAAGQQARYSFTVNVRQPEGQPTGQGGTGTPGLDLVFGGSAPRLAGIGIARATPPVLYLAGDSTVCDQPAAPYGGWGQALPQFLRRGLSVANYADSGESSGSFLAKSTLFATMEPLLRPGDHVFIQFGHNDKNVTASVFNANLTTLVNRVRATGGVPVLITPPVRRQLDANDRVNSTGMHINGLGVDLPAEMRRVASANNVPLIDLTAKSRALVERLGRSGSERLFLTDAADGVTDNTHFSTYGAGEMARLVLEGIRERDLTAVLSHLR